MIKYIKDLLHELRTKDKCFAQNNKNGVCYGKHGGDQYTEYLSYSCVDCPHLTFIFSEDKIMDNTTNRFDKFSVDEIDLIFDCLHTYKYKDSEWKERKLNEKLRQELVKRLNQIHKEENNI